VEESESHDLSSFLQHWQSRLTFTQVTTLVPTELDVNILNH
jgi:hypothetical protein